MSVNDWYQSVSIRVSQTEALIRKNGILYLRRWKSTLLQIIAPILIVVLLLGLDALVISSNSSTYTSPKIFADTQNMPRCSKDNTANKDHPCYSLAYAVEGKDAARVMDLAISMSGLDDDEVHAVSRPDGSNATGAVDRWILDHQNTTYMAVALGPNRVDPSVPDDAKSPVAYHLFYNTSKGMPSVSPLQTTLDNAIVAYQLNTSSPSQFIRVSFRGYPKPSALGEQSMPVSGTVGPQFLCFAMMILFVILVYLITNEKHRLLRLALVSMGLTDLPYWLSWFLSASIISIIVTFAVSITGVATRIPLFAKTNFVVLILMFGLFSLSLVGLAFLVSAVVSRPKSGLILSFVVVGVTFIVNGIFTNTIIVYGIYSFNPTWLRIIRILLFLYPPFNFGKVYADLFFAASPRLDKATNQYVSGPGFSFSDLFRDHSYAGFLHAPPSFHSLLLLVADFALFTALAVYIDAVFPRGTGIARSPLFPFMPSYWGISVGRHRRGHNGSSSSSSSPLQVPPMPPLPEDVDPDIAAEVRHAFDVSKPNHDDDDLHDNHNDDNDNSVDNNNNNNNNIDNTLRILDVHKVYSTIRQKVRAVNGVSLTAETGACTALLGHNGAGKTTTINMVTGLAAPSSGSVLLMGHCVQDGLQGMRRRVGVCPQHDVLWDELTAGEHLRLFARVKGVPRGMVKQEIGDRLKDVALSDVRHRQSGTFSGGMKRRLSVAVSMVGDPALVLLDEPTTGMDPHSRRQVWHLIHTAKRDRIVLLTTHSMEEAEALADKIAIMAFGQVRCVGDVLHLKNRYGAGYNLSLQAQPGRSANVKRRIDRILPSARLVSDNAGSLMYNLAGPSLGELVPVLEDLETAMEQGDDLKDWGISQTTLEEVYLRVTQEAHFGFGTNSMAAASSGPYGDGLSTGGHNNSNNNNNNNTPNTVVQQ